MDLGIVNTLADRMDEEAARDAILDIIQDRLYPHLKDIREDADEAEDAEEVRELYESLDDETKNELFHDTWANLIAQTARLRNSPVDASRELKTMIRDPFTLEAMLLIMDHETIPEDTQESQKDLLATYVHWLGIALAPEAYTREEVEDVVDQFGGIDETLLDQYDRQRQAHED